MNLNYGRQHRTRFAHQRNDSISWPWAIGYSRVVVDDRRDVRFLVQVFINKLGGKTVLCENGKEALARIRSDQSEGLEFDIVLMDMQMPVMDGITAVRQLRSEGYNRPRHRVDG